MGKVLPSYYYNRPLTYTRTHTHTHTHTTLTTTYKAYSYDGTFLLPSA